MLSFVVFTFQSGSILMQTIKSLLGTSSTLYIPIWFYSNSDNQNKLKQRVFFTFQSGSILIDIAIAALTKLKALHSNLVLF